MSQVTIPAYTVAMIETGGCQMRQIERVISVSSTPEAIKNARKAIARLAGLTTAIVRSAISAAIVLDIPLLKPAS